MDLHLYDQNCPFCSIDNREYVFQFSVRYKSIDFIVHCCFHCQKPYAIAMEIIGELYDEINTSTCWRNSDLEPALRYGICHRGYWDHECNEYHLCSICGGRSAYKEFREAKGVDGVVWDYSGKVITLFNAGTDWISELLDRRFCERCFDKKVQELKHLNERLIEQWLEKHELEKLELAQLRKIQKLFSSLRKAMKENKGQEVLLSLKTEFEQVANLRG